MKVWLVLIFSLTLAAAVERVPEAGAPSRKKVFVLPIRDEISSPMVYLVRRGVKEAMEARADLLVVDMDTNGGRVDATEEIMEVLNRFKGQTVTYVNRKAFSAGAFISVATQKIYMAPQSVIGAAAPILLAPGGAGVEQMPNTMEVKTTSALSALVRTAAEKNGHNVAVIDAMIDKSKELKMDGEVLNEKGQILTLTDVQAAKLYGDPPKPLLSAGTVETLEALLEKLGYADAERRDVRPTGAEKLGAWLNAISPLLLLIGIIGLYIEFKTPGFGVPGIIGIAAFLLYFVGGYVAGLSGLEWIIIFILGLTLVALEFFAFPGVMVLGALGAILMLAALVMALADAYPVVPGVPGVPNLPAFTWETFQRPVQTLTLGLLGAVGVAALLARFLPKTPIYRTFVSQSASGVQAEAQVEERRAALQGQIGVALSNLRPGGKARFGDQILDVMSQGDLVAKGTRVRIVGYSGPEAIVEVAR
jgi:membrane-bound serine protease (ClpP class)